MDIYIKHHLWALYMFYMISFMFEAWNKKKKGDKIL